MLDTVDEIEDAGVRLVKQKLLENQATRTWPWTQAQLGRALGITKQGVNQWRHVPPQHALAVCELLDLDPKLVRPDIFAPRVISRDDA